MYHDEPHHSDNHMMICWACFWSAYALVTILSISHLGKLKTLQHHYESLLWFTKSKCRLSKAHWDNRIVLHWGPGPHRVFASAHPVVICQIWGEWQTVCLHWLPQMGSSTWMWHSNNMSTQCDTLMRKCRPCCQMRGHFATTRQAKSHIWRLSISEKSKCLLEVRLLIHRGHLIHEYHWDAICLRQSINFIIVNMFSWQHEVTY